MGFPKETLYYSKEYILHLTSETGCGDRRSGVRTLKRMVNEEGRLTEEYECECSADERRGKRPGGRGVAG